MNDIGGVAFFDFDGTICKKDSFLAFILYTKGPFQLGLCLLKHLPFILLYYLKLYPNDRLKEDFFSYFFKGVKAEDLEKSGLEFCENRLPQMIYPDAMRLIQWHQAQNHLIYLVTASSEIWLGAWCKQHNIQCAGTVFETRDGVYTGKIKGKNCHGKYKAKMVRDILHLHPNARSFGYGNGQADTHFLHLVQHAFNGPLLQKNVDQILVKKSAVSKK